MASIRKQSQIMDHLGDRHGADFFGYAGLQNLLKKS